MKKLKGSVKPFSVYHTDAYMIAVKNGFEGTEAEWLESLKGKPGYTPKKGIDYVDGEKGDPFTFEDFTEEQLAELYDNQSALSKIGKNIINGKLSSIVLLGDSITDGAGGTGYNGSYSNEPSTNTLGYCWANSFKKFVGDRYGVSVTNKGMYGTTMVAQKDKALEFLTENDFVIWLTGTNDRFGYDAFQTSIRSCIDAVKAKCAGVLIVSNIPATKSDEKEHPTNMQKMDEIITEAAVGCVPFFSMYQAFTQYCEQHGIAISDCLADHVHPNDLGYYIMFKLLCQNLGLPLDPYTHYECEKVLFANTEYESSYTGGIATATGIVPCVYMNGHDSNALSTAISGKHITRVEVKVGTAGTITFGTVDLNTIGTQYPVYVQSKKVEVASTGLVSIDLDMDIGVNETFAIQNTDDTGAVCCHIGADTEENQLRFVTSANFRNNKVQCVAVYGSIYGH